MVQQGVHRPALLWIKSGGLGPLQGLAALGGGGSGIEGCLTAADQGGGAVVLLLILFNANPPELWFWLVVLVVVLLYRIERWWSSRPGG